MKIRGKSLLLALAFCAGLCGCGANHTIHDEMDAEPGRTATTTISYNTEYDYVIYGSIQQIEPLSGCDYDVVAIRPLSEGGEPYEGYPWQNAFIPKTLTDSVLLDEEGNQQVNRWVENEDGKTTIKEVCFKIKATNSSDEGGFIDLPLLILEIEEIAADDIPIWGGL